MEAPWRVRAGVVEVRVRVTPRGGRDAVEGRESLSDGSAVLKVRVRAVPEDGAANEAVRRLLAKAVGVPASRVAVAAGHTARVKTLTLAGDPAPILAALEGFVRET